MTLVPATVPKEIVSLAPTPMSEFIGNEKVNVVPDCDALLPGRPVALPAAYWKPVGRSTVRLRS